MSSAYFLWIASIGFGALMALAVGANDLANSMGSSVGAKSISVRTAVILAAIFEGAGALLASGQVTSTLKETLFVVDAWQHMPMELAFGMLSALCAASLWLLIATHHGWPVSTTHTIVGAILGFTSMLLGCDAIRWSWVGWIILSWVAVPVMAAMLSYFILDLIQRWVFDVRSPLRAAQQCLPLAATLVVGFISTALFCEHLTQRHAAMLLLFLVLIYLSCRYWIMRLIRGQGHLDYTQQLIRVESAFGALTVFTACAMAFSHGGNDVSNALGPMSAILDILKYGRLMPGEPMPFLWVLLGAFCVVLGLATYGQKIMQTVGQDITKLTPSRAFAAECATAMLIMLATIFGMPVSTTQTLVGSVFGVGMTQGLSSINLDLVKRVILSWILTVPVGALLSMFFYVLFRSLFA